MLIITSYLYSFQFTTQGTGYFHSRACPVTIFSITLEDVHIHRNSLTWAGPDPQNSVVVYVKMGIIHGKISMQKRPGCTRVGSKSSCLWECLQPQGMGHGSYWMIRTFEDFWGLLRCPDSNPPHHWLFPLGKFLGVDWQDYMVFV